MRWLGVLFVVAVLAIWQAVSVFGLVDGALLPPVTTILAHWIVALTGGTLLGALGESLARMALGYASAAIVGITLGILMGRVRIIWALFEPVLELLRPVPIPAFIPLLILFLGVQSPLKVAVVFVGALFPIVLATYAGVRALPSTLSETAITFRLTWWQTVREIVVPAVAPAIVVGLRTSLAIALIVEVVAEMIAGTGGIGYYILQAEEALRVVDMYVGIFTLAVVGYALNFGFLAIERVVIPWHAGGAHRAAPDARVAVSARPASRPGSSTRVARARR
jgi:ABC-type nitrate/sulfonate/bicarbonate transport system permease component